MDVNVVSRVIKAVVAVAAVAGINISPENAEAITQGALAVYAVMSLIQAKFENA